MSLDTAAEMFLAALGAHATAREEDIHVSVPGRIESYDATHQRATVQPLIMQTFVDETGAQVSRSHSPLTDVPVEFFGGGDYMLAFPVAKGMTCRLDFCSAAIDKFLSVGGEVDPKDGRKFSLTDAVCVLGLRDFAHAFKNLPSNAWVMAAPTGSQIRLGSVSAVQKAILGDLFKSAHTTLINSIVTALNGIAPGSGTPVSTALSAFNAVSWLASKVRVE